MSFYLQMLLRNGAKQMKLNFQPNWLLICIVILYSTTFAVAQPADPAEALKNKGIGPIKSVELSAVDNKLAAQGKEAFTSKCSACHKIGERYVGPDLAGVTKRRSPEWIMNMILNPQEMIQKDPIAQELFGEFLVPMTFQNVTEKDARAILEYIREQNP